MEKPALDTYLSLCTQVYDISLPTPPADEYTFFKAYAQAANGPILEPMCGTGRFLLPLMKDGFEIEGFDASQHMLKALNIKAQEESLKPNVTLHFVEAFKSTKKYGLIFIPSGSFNLITDRQEIARALKKFYDLLLPQGTLVIEIITLSATPQDPGTWRREKWNKPDGSLILASACEAPLHDNVSHTTCRYELIENNCITKTEEEIVKIRLYEQEEFHKLLLQAGFSRVRPIKAFAINKAPEIDDKDIIFECKK